MVRIALSFDDGRKDNYRIAKEVLEPLKIPATFNITTGYILDVLEEKDKPGPHEAMSIEELKCLAKSGLFEIAGHGFRHDNDLNNLMRGVLKLRELLPGVEIKGVASPHSQFRLEELQNARKVFEENGLHYLRISNDYSQMNTFRIWERRINRLLHIPSIYYKVNYNAVIQKQSFLLHSVPVIKDNNIYEVKGFVDRLIENKCNENKTCIFMFHSVLKKNEQYYEDLFSWDYYTFIDLCNYFKIREQEDKLSIIKTCDI